MTNHASRTPQDATQEATNEGEPHGFSFTRPELTFKVGRPNVGADAGVKIYGDLLRVARNTRGLSGEEMLALLRQAGVGLSIGTLYSLERSLIRPSLEQARVIGAVYGVTVDRLIEPTREASAAEAKLRDNVRDDIVTRFIEQLESEIANIQKKAGA
jgi:transcriptional regulator with XRE-family HTH domain